MRGSQITVAALVGLALALAPESGSAASPKAEKPGRTASTRKTDGANGAWWKASPEERRQWDRQERQPEGGTRRAHDKNNKGIFDPCERRKVALAGCRR